MPASQPVKPLASSLADDPDLEEPIDHFVVTLGERVDALQDAEAAADLPNLAKRAEDLLERARDLGYEPLARVASTLVSACADHDLPVTHDAVVEVTELSKRIRRGHRSSA